MAASLPPYEYDALEGSRTIRLLRLLPSPEPTFEIISVKLQDAPSYMALSYTWGSPTSTESVVVNGKSVTVPKNLANAARHMRDFLTERHLLLWADSIVINQKDFSERSQQVRIMHSIYQGAQCVGIWLGESADDSDMVMERMKEWKDEYDRICEPYESWETVVSQNAASDATFWNPDQADAWRAFSALLQRAWWGRAWIVQEATALSHERTLLFCGDRMINWPTLGAALDISHPITRGEKKELGVTFDPANPALRLDRFRSHQILGRYESLFPAIDFLRNFECQNPRDKLYAAIGLASDVSEDDIIPDYTKPLWYVYADIARSSISHSRAYCLDFLGLVDHMLAREGNPSDMPSWVPDLRLPPPCAFTRYQGFRQSDLLPRAYGASGDIEPSVTIEDQSLRVRGFELEQIERVYAPCYDNYYTDGYSKERMWSLSDDTAAYPTGGTALEALSSTLLADLVWSNLQSETFERGGCLDWALLDQDDSTRLSPEETLRRTVMLIDMTRATLGRRLFITKSGLIGLGPETARVGDNVCVLFGGHVLYVLREKPLSAFHQFIGECYVHGMMDGQALQSSNPRKKFVIT